ncbi:hypothetical protein MMC17_004114 [Xylographa soralifera]|nr:hypothetical protein [Xylographa soralifera]
MYLVMTAKHCRSQTPQTEMDESLRTLESALADPLFFSFTVELAPGALDANGTLSGGDGLQGSGATIIGSCGAHRLPEAVSNLDLSGYIIERVYWGKGYATEALLGFLETYWRVFPDGYPGLEGDERHFLDLHIFPENTASLSVARKCGFVIKGQEKVKNRKAEGEIVLDIWRLWRPGHEGTEAFEV